MDEEQRIHQLEKQSVELELTVPSLSSVKQRLISSYKVKQAFVERDMGQTNEQQRQHHFNEWPISELHGEVESIHPV